MPESALGDAKLMSDRILDAARSCCDRWGIQKVTVDDIVAESGVSRATLYRLFPGGRDVLFEALREREIRSFLAELDVRVADAETLEELVVGVIVHALGQLRSDTHLRLMMASAPGEVALTLGVESMPNIVRLATTVLGPRLTRFLAPAAAAELAEWVSRVVVSFFLAPSALVDLTDPGHATAFVRRFVLPAFLVTAH
jgi:hypothetical protein